jgi:hypothetical protein
MDVYEWNTGKQHPLAGGIRTSNKRATGSVTLTDYNDDLWYGTISIGTDDRRCNTVFHRFSSHLADGLMCMGFRSISTYAAPPPIQNHISPRALTKPMFGFKLASSGSELYFGGVNSKLHKGRFT